MCKDKFPHQSPAANLATASADLAEITDPQARDWAGFFQALATFFSAVAPVVIPLFFVAKPNEDQKKAS